MLPTDQRTPAQPPVALAFLGDGWSWIDPGGHGSVVRQAAIAADHRCMLPADPARARRAALDTLAWIDAMLASGWVVAGYLGYELGAALEHIPAGAGHQGSAARRDLGRRAGAALPDAALWAFAIDAAAASRGVAPTPSLRCDRSAAPELPRDLLRQRPRFIAAVDEALHAIAAGRYYQINVSSRFETSAPRWLRRAPLDQALARLRAPQPVPYAMAMQIGAARYFSLSMERFLSIERDAAGRSIVRSRPIKGTVGRGVTAVDDLARRARLLTNPKERAENTMIVDMVRNDLSRVAEIGGVHVPTLLAAVPYRTLWHLESEVEARVPRSVTASQLLRATLPPASVTGCPKVAAMRAIAQLERRRRGPYCGALGVWHPDGRAELSVAIRGIAQRDRRAWLDVGAGIVADSRPALEWDETCLKARAALRGLEAGEPAEGGAQVVRLDRGRP